MNMGMEKKRALKVTQVFKPLGTGGRGWWQDAIESGEPRKRVFKAGNRDLHIGHIAFEGLAGCVCGHNPGHSELELKNIVWAEGEDLGVVSTGVIVEMANYLASSVT